jgi:UDP-glucose 4-epimerase
LVKKLNRNTIKKNYEIDIYGNDYNTKDGTCIRDYIDVNDLSNIHIDVMKNLKKNQSVTLNCGYKNGYSVNDIVDNFEKCIDHKITRKIKKRRLGDIESIVSNNLKLVKFIKKQYRGDLTNSLVNSIKWEKKIKKGSKFK